MSEPRQAEPTQVEIQSHFVRGRNALFLSGSFSPLYVDYYLHLMQHGLQLDPEHDAMLKEALTAMALHLASRPRDEATAWTINLQAPLLNLFVTGDSKLGNVCGRVFTQDVKVGARNLFVSQVSRPRLPTRQSTVEVHGKDVLRLVEEYYAQSEQLPARYFSLPDERYVMGVVHPDCDRPWFDALDVDKVARLAEDEELSLLETRVSHFGCGCDLERIYSVLAPIARAQIEDLFHDQTSLRVQCPRCAGVFRVERSGLEAYLNGHPEG